VPMIQTTSLGTPSIYNANNVGIDFKLASGSTIYAVVVTRGTPTFTATSDVNLLTKIVQY